jgi:glycosyltransferase involved in cell wall biosynthesis
MVNMASYAVVVVLAQFGRPRPDVVVGSTVHPFAALAGWIVARLRGARFVYEVRDLWPQTLIDLGAMRPTSPGARLLWAIETLLVRRAETVITLLPGMASYLEGRGLPTAHVRYLPNGVDLTDGLGWPVVASPNDRERVRSIVADASRRRDAGEVLFIYLGAHGRVNRLDVVIDAIHRASEWTAIPVRLLLVGDGPEKPALRERASALGVSNVEFLDPVPKVLVPELLGGMDIGVVHTTYTPVYRYGMSFNKLFDYMAARLPIAFACATAFDPVAASGAGLTVPPDDSEALANAFVSLVEAGPEERRRMGEAGRALVERDYDMARIGDRFADIVDCPRRVVEGDPERPYTRTSNSPADRSRSRDDGADRGEHP